MNTHWSGEESVKIYGIVLSVGMACSLAIVSVYETTKPIIQRNRVALRQDAILDLLPMATTSVSFRLDESTGQFQPTSSSAQGSDVVFAGFDRAGKLVGVAIETHAMGYQDEVRLMYGYSPCEQAIIGIRVLESRETPGLGDRIETDAKFLSNFGKLDVALDTSGTGLANPIEFVRSGQKTAAWQVDGITGATISSRAVAAMLRESTANWIPLVKAHRTDFVSIDAKDQ